jgi:hypothetical protein
MDEGQKNPGGLSGVIRRGILCGPGAGNDGQDDGEVRPPFFPAANRRLLTGGRFRLGKMVKYKYLFAFGITLCIVNNRWYQEPSGQVS